MQRTLCLLLTLGLATATILPSLQAQAEAPATTEVKLYLNRDTGGNLTLSSLAPSSRNATTWTVQGHYYTSQGLRIVVPLQDPNPNWVIDESQPARGWITWSFSQTRGTSLLSPLQGYNYGSFKWELIQGERTSTMAQVCVQKNATYSSRCDAYEYRAEFPGHQKGGTPHTHGDGTDPSRGLHSGDLDWVLSYVIPPCSGYQCTLGGGSMSYKFSILLDGTTFLQYAAVDENAPAPAPITEPENVTDNATASNQTSDPEDPEGNSTGNQTGSGGEPNSFRPRAYDPKSAQGTAPGAGLAAILATLGVAGAMTRRLRQ